MTIAEIRCQLYPGQFSSEYAVVVESLSGRVYSLFASRDGVANDREPTLDEPTDGWLRVKVLSRRETTSWSNCRKPPSRMDRISPFDATKSASVPDVATV